MKITLKEINKFLTDNPNKRIIVSSDTNCVIAQILKQRGVKDPCCEMDGPNTATYDFQENVVKVPVSWNRYNEWINENHLNERIPTKKIIRDLRKFSRKGDTYYL